MFIEESANRRNIFCKCLCSYPFHLGLLPILFGVCVLLTFIITYIIAVSDEHVYPYFPTISDTGGEKPESNIFGLFLSICSFLGFTVVIIRFIQFRHISENNEEVVSRLLFINQVTLFFGIVACFGAVVVANFQDRGKSAEAHAAGAVFVFGGGVVYCCFQTYLTFHMLECGSNSKSLYCIRLFLSFTSATFFICFGILFYFANKAMSKGAVHSYAFWNSNDPGYVVHVFSSISEWLCALCILVYFISFSGEFDKIKISLSVRRNYFNALPFQIGAEDIDDLSEYA